MATVNHRRGDTFELPLTYTNDEDQTQRLDLTSVTIASTMEHRANGTRFDLTVTKTDAEQGEIVVSAAYADTAAWETGLWKMDVQRTDGTDRVSSAVFYINVIEDVT